MYQRLSNEELTSIDVWGAVIKQCSLFTVKLVCPKMHKKLAQVFDDFPKT